MPAPDNLVPTDQVEPARNDGRGNVASLLDPRVDVSGAPRADAGFYQVGSSAAHVDVELGQLRSALGDGHLGAAYDGDRVVVTVDAPYLYFTDDGTLKETLSPEEWLQNGGQEAGMRAAVVADEVPEGWSVWTRWSAEEGYQRVGDDDVRSGVSGRIVLRYDGVEGTDTAGGRLRADSVMPSFDLRFAGDVPAGRDVSVPVVTWRAPSRPPAARCSWAWPKVLPAPLCCATTNPPPRPTSRRSASPRLRRARRRVGWPTA